MQQQPTDIPQGAALVLDRWNSWVQLYFSETEETRWIDLAEFPGYETIEPADAPSSHPRPER